MRKGLVLQQNGRTVAVPSSWLQRNISFSQMIAEAAAKHPDTSDNQFESLAISGDQVQKWDLRFADEATFELEGGQVVVKAVNGLADAEVCRNRPHFLDDLVEGLQLRFGTEEIPIDRSGLFNMKLMRMIAPIPFGGKGAITGPANCGKTWMMRDLTRALLSPEVIPTPSRTEVDIIAVDVGERVPDVGTRADIFADYTGPINIEHYHGFQHFTATNNALIARERAHRLTEMGHCVFLLLDSLWGLVRQLGKTSNGGGYAGKGVPTQALEQALPFLHAGRVAGGGALTVIPTSLDEGEGTRSRVVLDEVGWQTMTSVWPLRLESPWRPRPWLDLALVGTRELEQFLKGERYELHLELQRRLWEGRRGKYADALEYLLELAQVPGTLEESVPTWRERWAKEDEKAKREKALEDHQALVNVASRLKVTTDAKKVGALVAAGMAMEVLWEDLAEAAYARVPPEPEVDPHPELPPPEEYVALGKRLEEEGVTQRSFKFATACKIRAAGVTLEELEKHLRAGGRPSDLYKEGSLASLRTHFGKYL